MKLIHLKSGTDIRGSAINPENPTRIDLSDEAVQRMTVGFLTFLEKKTGKAPSAMHISLGHDSRLSADRISAAVRTVLLKSGVFVTDCGLCSTPAMFMTTVELPCDAAVQITASHHPWDRNGLKFFTREGGLSGADITEILECAEHCALPAGEEIGKCETVCFLDNYAEILRRMICDGVCAENHEKPLAGLRIAVDAGNGAGGFYAEKVLAPLGADVSGSRYLEPDGRFPNHIPNPENKQAMESIREATLEAGADLGVIFDTDVDRAGCVSPDGAEINRNRLVAMAAAIALEACPGGTVVTDSVTSGGLTEFIERHLGGKHLRFKRGYKNVIDEAARRCALGENAPLAIETSGHAAFRENYFLDDGAYLITKIIIKAAQLRKAGKALKSLIDGLSEPAEECELRLNITAADFRSLGNRVLENVGAYASAQDGWETAPDNYEGIKVSFPEYDGFFILRLSVHDPIMPLNIESNQVGGCKRIAEALSAVLNAETELCTDVLNKFTKGY